MILADFGGFWRPLISCDGLRWGGLAPLPPPATMLLVAHEFLIINFFSEPILVVFRYWFTKMKFKSTQIDFGRFWWILVDFGAP